MPDQNTDRNDDAQDLLWGAEAIGAAIGLRRQQAFRMLENQLLPAKKIGGKWVASRRKLLAAMRGE